MATYATNLDQYFSPQAIDAMTVYFQSMIDAATKEIMTNLQNNSVASPTPEFLNLGDAAKAVSVSRTTLRKYIRNGSLPVTVLPDTNAQRIGLADIKAFMNTNKVDISSVA